MFVKQTITLPARARDLYAMYLNPRTHKAITGGKVVISARPGSKFSAFGGMLRGRTLYTVPGRLGLEELLLAAVEEIPEDLMEKG